MTCEHCADGDHYECVLNLLWLNGQRSCCCGWMTEVEFTAAVAEAKRDDFADDAWHR